MKANLIPLSGKYYGTKIEIDFDDSGQLETILIWETSNREPSIRELNKKGYTEKQWIDNEFVDSGWDSMIPIKELGITSDNHFENRLSYERALKIVNLLNGKIE